MIKKLGFNYYRFDVPVDSSGNIRNETNFYQLVKLSKPAHIGLLPMIYMMGMNFNDNSQVSYNKGRTIGNVFAQKYGAYFDYFELGNEQEIALAKPGTSGSSPDDYDVNKLDVLASFYKGMIDGIKSQRPGAKTIINTGGWFHFVFFDLLKKKNVNFDIIGYHWYSDMDEYSKKVGVDIVKTISARTNKPIWFTEVNTAFGTFKTSEEEQKKWLESFTGYCRKYKAVQAVFIYELLDETKLPMSSGGERFYGIAKWQRKQFALKLGARVMTTAYKK
ncbi:glycosyl hydrolase [Mucilaginibacter sp. PPCGB 2223]|uniref:glycosyl hydrolase n=1 Tax=Mucilaginibacter sp. PPCGB 2223 TaxID=1886027 RepID=UPI0015866085|nr:glycosyl hydrolase [Mucilaginibacter sp. PPCGB 2223]